VRVIPYLIYLLLIAFHVVILQDATSIYTAFLNLPALIVLVVAIYKDDLPATWFGFVAGLVAFAGGPPTQLGWQGLLMGALALIACQVRDRLNLESLRAKLMLVAGGILAHNTVVLLISRADGFLLSLATFVLAGAVYTSVAAWLFFLFKERVITIDRIKAIF
jgi:hypothetical protein